MLICGLGRLATRIYVPMRIMFSGELKYTDQNTHQIVPARGVHIFVLGLRMRAVRHSGRPAFCRSRALKTDLEGEGLFQLTRRS